MTREELNRLADRVEALTGPDREVDWLVYEAIGEPVVLLVRAATAGRDEATWAPFYSQSLDAAMSLVPDGYSWTLGQNVHHGHWLCSINYVNREGEPTCLADSGHRKAPALALTAAALRARAEQLP